MRVALATVTVFLLACSTLAATGEGERRAAGDEASAGSGAPGARVGSGTARRVPPPMRAPLVVNEVVDLLDADVYLESDTEDDLWESREFDTSQFTVIGLHVSGEIDGSVGCHLTWRFTADDGFRGASPSTWIGTRAVTGRVASDPEFGAVRGLRAKVVCAPTIFVFGDFGHDPPPEPEPSSGTVSDVKVLLRRY
jgi:hypothetical protein